MKKLLPVIFCLSVIIAIFAIAKHNREPEIPTVEITGETSLVSHGDEIQKEIKLGYFKEKSLNPYKTSSPLNRSLSTLVYDSLFVVEDNFTVLPLMAETVSYEGNKLSVDICDEMYFSDGSLITTNDVVYSFRLAKESSFYSKRLSNFNTAAKGETSVIFTLNSIDTSAESNLIFPIVKFGTGSKSFPVGSGRYKFKKSDGKLYLKENEYSTRGEEMATDSVRLTPISADASELYQLQSGDLTAFFDDLSKGSFTKINANMVRVPLNNLVYLGLNCENKFLRDSAVKKAIELCTDKNTISDTAYSGYCRIADTIFNPDWEVTANAMVPESVFSVVQAEEVLEKADYVYAYKNNKHRSKDFKFLTLRLIVNKENKSRSKAADIIAKNLRSAGFEIKLQKLSYEDYSSAIKSGNFDLYVGEVALSPGMDFSAFFSGDGELSAGIDVGGTVGGAYFDYKDGTIDFSTFNQVINHEKPFIPICYRDGMMYFSRELSYEGTVNQFDLFKNAYSWEIK